MTLFNELQGLMIKYRFRPTKKIAQHFTVDPALIETLVNLADLKKEDTVLEIGAGTGFLTKELLKKCKVIAVELDERLCLLLSKELPKENLSLIEGDFLEAELPSFNKVVSLPPYCRSAEIMFRLLRHDFEFGVIVFQKEFAEKLVSWPGLKEYCALSVLVQYFFEAKIVQVVPSKAFFPQPKDESAIVMLKRHKEIRTVKDTALFELFVKTVFRFRNKNLRNALEKGRQFLLQKMKLGEKEFNKRAMALQLLEEKVNLIPVQDFVEIFNAISKKG